MQININRDHNASLACIPVSRLYQGVSSGNYTASDGRLYNARELIYFNCITIVGGTLKLEPYT